jgi:hypothetical protein
MEMHIVNTVSTTTVSTSLMAFKVQMTTDHGHLHLLPGFFLGKQNIAQVAIINANLVHLMAATIFIALPNTRYWLQDQ